MPDLLERVSGLFAVAVDVFTQVSVVKMSVLPQQVAHASVLVCIQKIRLRGLPAIDKIGGPAEGLTYIVTGPTRFAFHSARNVNISPMYNLTRPVLYAASLCSRS